MIWGQEYLLKKPQKQQSRKVQLYDVFKDPSEITNLAEEFPDVVSSLQEEILAAKKVSLVVADYPKGKYMLIDYYSALSGGITSRNQGRLAQVS